MLNAAISNKWLVLLLQELLLEAWLPVLQEAAGAAAPVVESSSSPFPKAARTPP
jgi:hypothetical protein